jgi:hypothetical protein
LHCLALFRVKNGNFFAFWGGENILKDNDIGPCFGKDGRLLVGGFLAGEGVDVESKLGVFCDQVDLEKSLSNIQSCFNHI